MTSKIVANGGKPQLVTLDVDLSKSDVGDIAAAVSDCSTPHAAKAAPSARLVLPASVSPADTEKVQKALAHVTGVHAKHCDAAKGQILVHVEKGAKLTDIRKALQDAGLLKQIAFWWPKRSVRRATPHCDLILSTINRLPLAYSRGFANFNWLGPRSSD